MNNLANKIVFISGASSGIGKACADDIAEAVLFCADRPDHVNINEIILTPVAQASATLVHRKNN